MTTEDLAAWLTSLQPGDEVAVGYGSSVSIETVYLVENDRIVVNSYKQGSCSNPSAKVRMSYDRQTGRGTLDTAAVLGPVMPGHRENAIKAAISSELLMTSTDEAAEILTFIKQVKGRFRGPKPTEEFLA